MLPVDEAGTVGRARHRNKDDHDKLEDAHEVTLVELLSETFRPSLHHNIAVVIEQPDEKERYEVQARMIEYLLIQRRLALTVLVMDDDT